MPEKIIKPMIAEREPEELIWTVRPMATQTEPRLYNSKVNEVYDIYESQAAILNYLERLMKLLQ